ncbi:MAG: hypothetical protein J6P19_05990 [Acetobacter sp.]|nr:hypothetical protein [Acetobacter sp.]
MRGQKPAEQKAILQLMKKNSSQTEQDICSDFDQYVLEKVSKHNQSWMQIVPLEGIIKKQLKRGFTKKTIYSYFVDKKLINCTYNTFYNFISKLEKKDPTKDKAKTVSIPKTQQTIQEDTSTEKIEAPKPEEQETNPTPKETQTTQTVEPEKSDALKRVEEHRQRVQAQRAAEATTETKTEQQTKPAGEKTFDEKVEEYFKLMMSDPEVYPNSRTESDANLEKFCAKNPREGRKFGDTPEGKDFADLPQELQDTIRRERATLRLEQKAIYKAVVKKWTQKAKEAEEKNKFHHDTEAKPPGYWTGGQLTGS